ncbi:RibD family protein [Halovulum dunhuangense]|uniref:RibD family protein n=1 Tax=Halovulum dunhuangense TaxID=1505036 RepID=A0A849KW81_9RHOB|nr:RibD family protein [Halovulum dunhuangense]NNU79445.1 RibD family protein [Halovulum dunhuangense]
MLAIDATPRLWAHLLDLRAGQAVADRPEWTAAERAALELYAPIARRDTAPLVLGQIGQSLDGRVATVTGDARDVSGPDGLVHLHRIRALVDAVVIGIGTALHDTPQLTVRLVPGDSPARVVIDPSGRLPDDAPMLAPNGARRIVVQAVDRPRPAGVEVVRLARTGERLQPAAILSALRERGLHSILVEGGSTTLAHFLEAGCLDRLHVAVAPLIIGAGPAGLTTSPVERLSRACRPVTRVYGLGSDVLFDCQMPEAETQGARPRGGARAGLDAAVASHGPAMQPDR